MQVALAAAAHHMKAMEWCVPAAQAQQIKAAMVVAALQTYLVAAVAVLVLLVQQHQVQKLAAVAATVLHPRLLALRLQEQVGAVEAAKVLEEQVALVVVVPVVQVLEELPQETQTQVEEVVV